MGSDEEEKSYLDYIKESSLDFPNDKQESFLSAGTCNPEQSVQTRVRGARDSGSDGCSF
jgi:hypothetical protein